MSTPVNIKEVAAHAGVSVGTVSNVLNRPEIVAVSTRDRVHEAIRTLGFVRSEPARQLRAGRSRTIGLVVLDVANPFFTDIARGVENEAGTQGLSMILCNSDETDAREYRHLELLEEHRVQGVLITPVGSSDNRLVRLAERGTPVVLVDSASASSSLCSVSVDDVHGGELAVTHLIECGHRRVAFLGGSAGLRQVADRREGGVRALKRAGADTSDLLVIDTQALTLSGGRAVGRDLAMRTAATRPTAAFCANDLVALGVLQEVTRHGISVPAEMAIVGYDDLEFAAAAAVPLTSVRQPRQELGRMAAQLLIEEISDAGRHKHRHVIFQPELQIRRSTVADAEDEN